MKKRKRENPILSVKDIEILYFLWRHRIATFQALKFIFYPEISSRQAYHKLARLQRGEFVAVEKIDGTANRVWCLALRGYKYLVQNHLPELKTKHFKPQSPSHDLLVVSVLLGRWVREKPKNVSLVTEQEMTTLDLEFLPSDLRLEMKHKSDGLWLINSGNEKFVIGLEVEPSVKSSERYENICSFYSNQIFFKHVVWIVQSKAHAKRILESSRKHGIPREGVHLFIEIEDFKNNEWDSKFLNESMKGITLGNFLGRMAKTQVPSFLQTGIKMSLNSYGGGLKNVAINPFLEFTLSFEKFDTSQDFLSV